MNEENIEQWLRSAKLKRLSDEADERITAVIHGARELPAPNWWLRGIPMWRTAAACVAVAVLTWAATVSLNRVSPQPSMPPFSEHGPVIENRVLDKPVYLTDASKWKVVYVSPEGRQE